MNSTRREFLRLASAGAAASLITPDKAGAAMATTKIRAVAFDGFPILDPRPVFRLLGGLFPGRGKELGSALKTRLFEYQWQRALAGQYADFHTILGDALTFSTRQLGLEITDEQRTNVLDSFSNLSTWPDVKPALQSLRTRGIQIAFLSNMTSAMLHAGIRNGGLEGLFDHVLSTNEVRTFKPDRRAYQMGVDAFDIPKEQIAFAAFAGWDVAGAAWFGYPTVWINRMGAAPEVLGIEADATGRDLSTLLTFAAPGG